MKRLNILLIILFTLIGIYFVIFIYLLRSEVQNIDILGYVVSKMQICNQSDTYRQCYRDLAKSLLVKYKLELPEILNELEKGVIETESLKLLNCHEIAHYLGEEAYKLNNNVQNLFNQCSQICLSGCFHGVVGEHLKQKKIFIEDDSAVEREIKMLCGKEEDYDSSMKYQICFHGIGHGLMYLTENDLPRALRLCESLSTKKEIVNCQNGVFMENSNSNPEHPSKYLKEGDTVYPCDTLDKKYHDSCYLYQSYRLIQIGKSWKKIFQLCYTFPKDHWDQCFRALGGSQLTITSDVEVMKANCSRIENPYYRSICISGAAEIVTHRFTAFNGDFSKTIKFCSIVDAESKEYCYTTIGQEVKKWTKDKNERVSVCSKIPEEEYRDVCIAATQK